MVLRAKLLLIILTGFVYYAGLGHQQTKHSHRFLFYAARMIMQQQLLCASNLRRDKRLTDHVTHIFICVTYFSSEILNQNIFQWLLFLIETIFVPYKIYLSYI